MKCAVVGCSTRANTPEIKLFTFPRTTDVCQKWIEFCKNDRLCNVTSRNSKNYMMCSLHFKNTDFTTKHCTRLNRRALPSVDAPKDFLPVPDHTHVSTTISSAIVPTKHPRMDTLPDIPSISSPVHLSSATYSSNIDSMPISSELLKDQPIPSELLKDHCYETIYVTESDSLSSTDTSESSLLKNSKPSYLSEHGRAHSSFVLQYEEKKEKVLRRLKNKWKGHKKKLREIFNFEKIDFLSLEMFTTAVYFLQSQLQYSLRRKRKWTVEEKVMILSIYKRNPSGYTLLREIFALPSKWTLITMLNAIPFRSGINDNIFTTLSRLLIQMQDCDRICCLMFDEMSLRENLHYNSKFDYIEGYEDYGHLGRTGKVARYAQVFMLRGLIQQWKQPIVYYFSNNEMEAEFLVQLVKRVIQACNEAGFCIVATICDIGTTNMEAIKLLGSTITKPFFQFLGQDIFTLYDPPHLLKSLRNCLLFHDVRCVVEMEGSECKSTASWTHIQNVYDRDLPSAEFRFLYKLTPSHMNLDNRVKLKVKTAAQVLSYTVSAVIMKDFLYGALPSDAVATATFVKLCDELFDSFNGYKEYAEDGKPLRCRLTSESPHWEFWDRAYKAVDKLEFLFPASKAGELPQVRRMPLQDGWLSNINALRRLWPRLQNKGGNNPIEYLIPRNLNQDPLENLLGLICIHSGFSEHPTVTQFVDGLKTCIFNDMPYQDCLQSSNCLDDGASVLSNLHTFLTGDCRSDLTGTVSGMTDEVVDDACPGGKSVGETIFPIDMSVLSIAHVCCYIARSILLHSDCSGCRDALSCANNNEYYRAGIVYEEYFREQHSFAYPSENLVKTVARGASLVDIMLDEAAHKYDIKSTICNAMKKMLDFRWINYHCVAHSLHLRKEIVDNICKICIPWWCGRYNRANRM